MNRFVTYSSREEWLEARRKGVGGSDVAVAAGVDPYRTSFRLYWEKKGYDFEDGPTDDRFEWGHRLEDEVAARFVYETGWAVKRPDPFTVYFHSDRIFSTPDFIVYDGETPIGVLQTKTARYWKFGDTMPLSWQIQAKHDAVCVGVPRAWLACLASGMDFKYAEVEVGDLPDTVKIAEDFLRALDEEKEPPVTDRDNSNLARLYAQSDESKSVSLDEHVLLLEEYRGRQLAAKIAERELAETAAKIKALLKESERGILADGTVVQYKTFHRKAYSVEESSYRKLSVRWPKGGDDE